MNRRIVLWSAFTAIVAAILAGAPNAQAALIAYEGFDYPNDGANALNSLNGGTGWTSAWGITTLGSGFTVSQDDASLASTAFPFSTTGDRAKSAGAGSGSNSMRAYRLLPSTFDLGAEGGVLYVSLLFQKIGVASPGALSNNMEVNLTAGDSGNGTVRFGSTSANNLFVNDSTSVPAAQEFGALTLGQTYFAVLKLESHSAATDIVSAIVYDPSESVPSLEPGSWDKTKAFTSTAVIDRIRLWIGVGASADYDEIRIGDTWASVAVPEPGVGVLMVLGGLGWMLGPGRRISTLG
jgi:hypothetical protein